jgi:hypothetical protein
MKNFQMQLSFLLKKWKALKQAQNMKVFEWWGCPYFSISYESISIFEEQ